MQRFLAAIGYADRFKGELPIETVYERYLIPLMNADAARTAKSPLFEARALHFAYLARVYMLNAFLVQHLPLVRHRAAFYLARLDPDYKYDALYESLTLTQTGLEKAVRLRDTKRIAKHHAAARESHKKCSGEAMRVLDAFPLSELQAVLDAVVRKMGDISKEDYELEMKTRAVHVAVLYLRSMVDDTDVIEVHEIEQMFIQIKAALRKFRRNASLVETERADIFRTNRAILRKIRAYHQAPSTRIPLLIA